MPLAKNLIEAAGNATQANYIEDVFSTYLYTGNATNRSITNGVDLSTKGGMVWLKSRSNSAYNLLFDTSRGAGKPIISNSTDAQYNTADTQKTLTAFNTDGFSLGTDSGNWGANFNAYTYASWTFRKQPKFFDVVTYTGNGTAGRTVAHNLGSVPGCMIVKPTSTTGNWTIYHRSTGATNFLYLNTTAAIEASVGPWNNTAPTSTVFTLGDSSRTNTNGETYVAYIFAHDAGGFGLTGTDNVISCGSASTDSGGNWTATLGYEPQWILWKSVGSGQWEMHDTMRGANLSETRRLFANLSNAEGGSGGPYVYPTATGFVGVNGPGPANSSIIYIAIRRGPMKVPTDATKVFKPVTRTGNGSTASVTGVGFAPDTVLVKDRNGATDHVFIDKLRGIGSMLRTPQTFAEYNNANSLTSFDQNGVSYSYLNYVNGNTVPYNDLFFKRAPSFFDEVVTTADSSGNVSFTHNLGVAPDLVIIKSRTGAFEWYVYCSQVSNPTKSYAYFGTFGFNYAPGSTYFAATSTTFQTFTGGWTANNGSTVAYLFGTAAGVSKVGSYTGNGSTQAIACGFAGGARFVLIKRTDSTGDWYVYDTARGMTTLTDPYLLLNSTAAESATLGSVTTTTGGFTVDASILAAVNTNAASYVFLAIA